MVLSCTKPPFVSAQQKKNCGFGIHSGNQEMQRLNHLLYMDDIKLYAATNSQLQELLRLTDTFSRTLKLYLGLKSAKHYVLQREN